MNEVYIIAAKRTPIGGFLGNLAEFSATQLGAIAIKEAYQSVGIDPNAICSVYMGNVLSANLGQSPARQASIFAGISENTDCTTVNKVCAAGMKATILGAQQIQLGLEDLVITGGMESMSNVPHYNLLRKPVKFGDANCIDGLLNDGLTDVYNNFHMGNAAEMCVEKYNLTREQQDEYALSSYAKAVKATNEGKFTNEIIPIKINHKTGETIVNNDEDIFKVIPEKVSKLNPVFVKNGTITAANASNLNDSAAALLLASKEAVEKYNLKPLAKIISYADAAQAPEWFTTAPSIAITKALKQAKLSLNDIDYFEINEAYAAVVLANQKILDLDSKKINIYGGAVAMGHPLGASGARIICTLISVLKQEGGKYGVASICNGGGGASAIIIENINL
ncbi:acetyl-CoA acetyltransferase [Flavobacterium psychrophilum]|uniref:acetyl-CoA C-acetyltransferase n=1 Tax=Flavobacterium psychrophilum (strain ATCC 49511 / DSM 21280 / CIP 103535 / JIP02/86) TaxID=402612 RepID=A6GZY1_FLAPJ|nr:acetyl-CoA C-acyltransferase [Flavobacterium psychrophilum]AIG30345.1 acetyl-CoA acetyltransferase [Flavobacterium psychrophilum]AIG32620.1 acetyl-CoA acetyltransferase [Flavobacterium psychrophilum]AIG34775.1 acetyl-CoA acetyltransferase [Flavobacterium psychrophilum]AIG37140.1 acetyl-CoA acetyltransferase [Flavobacterium psychrophilum]AIG39404.1 acetyl-CoA acetyltransferase [Flavobacterium psychrophilum]